MERVILNKSLEISRIVYGMWRINNDDPSPSNVSKKIRACLEQGITTIDQADIYAGYEAEAILGRALTFDKSLREQIEIITKCGIIAPVNRYADKRVKHYDTSAKHINKSVDLSLSGMGIDYIDLLLIHRPDPFMDHHETGAALDALVTSGKVRAVGVSNFKPHDYDLLSSAMKNSLVTNQIEISVKANQGFTNGDIAHLQKHEIPPMAWSPLAGGELFNNKKPNTYNTIERISKAKNTNVAAVAIAWLLAHPAKIIPIMGTNNISRIKALSAACEIDIDLETWFEIYENANGVEVP